MSRARKWIAFGLFLAGVSFLAIWFKAFSPVTHYVVIPQEKLTEKGREVAAHFGVDVKGWTVSQVVTVSNSLSHYVIEHPIKQTPLSLRFNYVSPKGERAKVGFDSAGNVNYWRSPAAYRFSRKYNSDEEAARAGFNFMAGAEADSYKEPSRTMGDEDLEQDYTWKRTPASKSELRDNITVVSKEARIESIEHKIYLASDDDDADGSDDSTYWSVLGIIYGLVLTAGVISMIGIYVLWLARRATNHRFPMRMASGLLVLMVGGLALDWNASASFGGIVFSVAAMLCFAAAGRGISEAARPKWMTLEQLCRLAPISRAAGESILAAIVVSPFMVSIPFLISGCGLFPQSWLVPDRAVLLYSGAPLVGCLNVQEELILLGFWGFGVSALGRLVRRGWIRWMILLPIGLVVFSESPRLISGPITAPLAASLVTLALFGFLWKYFDLLAVIFAPAAGGILWALLILAQKGRWDVGLMVALAGLMLAGAWCYRRGREISEGDPSATVPAFDSFRNEREKLRAEFSVARRAQQDMLPQTPPIIPGYSIAASCTPSLEVGGDLYDFLKLPDGRIGMGVADVSGKGVPAALYMTLTKGLLASVSKSNSEIASVVEHVNRHLHSVTRKKVFVTMALGFLDAEKRVLECVRAGHNPMVWRQADRDLTTLVGPGGLGLGITASRIFANQLKVAELALSKGDAVVFYSDGITEAMNIQLEQFGEQRLMSAVERTDNLDAAGTRDSILQEVRAFLGGVHPQDDMTVVVLRVGDHQ